MPSISVKKTMSEYFPLYKKKGVVVPIPVDTDVFDWKPNVQNKVPTFITACMIKPIRNLESIINVISALCEETNVQWLLAGEEPFYLHESYKTEIWKLIEKNHLCNTIKFMGGIYNVDVLKKFYYFGDMYIDCSLEESYGQAKLEAISCGKVVLMPKVGNNKNLIHRDCEILLCEDEYEMTQKAKKLLNDKAFYDEISLLNREYVVENYSYYKVINMIKEYL